jgi:hypothetical protein
MLYTTLGDGLDAFRKANGNKLCGSCGQATLFPYKIAPMNNGHKLCEVYCSRCGKTAESFKFSQNTLETTKSRKSRRVVR